jgi:hypothetical protein
VSVRSSPSPCFYSFYFHLLLSAPFYFEFLKFLYGDHFEMFKINCGFFRISLFGSRILPEGGYHEWFSAGSAFRVRRTRSTAPRPAGAGYGRGRVHAAP